MNDRKAIIAAYERAEAEAGGITADLRACQERAARECDVSLELVVEVLRMHFAKRAAG